MTKNSPTATTRDAAMNDAMIHPSATKQPTTNGPLWLCLHFSQLALDIFGTRERPSAVIEQRCVHCSNRDDLPPGLALATAQALYPDLLALERERARETEWLQGLADWAYRFTPAVVLAADNSLLLEIGSCRRLYRGIANLLEQLRGDLQRRGYQALMGLAHTPKAAWLLAHGDHGIASDSDLSALPLHNDRLDKAQLRQQMHALPIALLDIDPKIATALQQAGVHTLGELRKLPLAALGKRFGETFIHHLQQLWGHQPDPQLFFLPAPIFQRGLTFIDDIRQRSMLLFPMKRLLQALDDYLRARQLHCHILRWQLFDAHTVQAEFSIELSRTQTGWRHLLELSRLKLELLPAIDEKKKGEKKGIAVFSIALRSADFFQQTPASDQLFPDANALHANGYALLDRLTARLGNAAVQQLDVHEVHWPEAAYTLHSPSPNPGRSFNTEAMPPATARPLWLLPQPKLLRKKNEEIFWHGVLTLLRGPERIGNHWWEQHMEERDYYVARSSDGSTCWIFCQRTTRQWYLHGLFA